MLLRDGRSQDSLDTQDHRVHEAELEHDHPEPRPRSELAPALPELCEEVRRLYPERRRQPDHREEHGRDEKRRSVDRDPNAGARGRHHEASECGSSDPARVLTEAEDRVRLLQHPLRDRLRDDPGRRREEERRAQPVDGGEHQQLPDLGSTRQQEDGNRTLAEAARDVRGDHHTVPREPVGPDSSDEQEDHLRQRARRQDEAEVGLRAGQVEDGERERDGRERVADERRRPAEEQEPEAALAERAELEAVDRDHGEILADGSDAVQKMEPTGLEPVASRLPARRSPN